MSTKRGLLQATLGLIAAVLFVLGIQADQPDRPLTGAVDKTKFNKEGLAARQKDLADKYREFEQSLLILKQRLEKSGRKEDRDRAAQLAKVLERSTGGAVPTKFASLVQFLTMQKMSGLGDVGRAAKDSAELARELKAILDLLRGNTDLASRREERLSLEKLLKEIERLIRDEKMVIGKIEDGRQNPKEVADAQRQVRNDTRAVEKKLGDLNKDKDDKNGPGGEAKDNKGESKGAKGKGTKGEGKDAGKKSEAKKGDGKDAGKGGEGKKGEAKENAKSGQKAGDPKAGQKGEAKSGAKSGDPKQGGAKSGAKSGDKQSGAKGGKGSEAKKGEGKGGQKGDDKQGEAKQGGEKNKVRTKGDDKQGEAKKADPKGGDKQGGAKSSQGGDKKSSQSKSGQSSASKPGQSKSSQSKSGQGSPKSGGQKQDDKQGDAKDDNNKKNNDKEAEPTLDARKRIQDAQNEMRRAEDKIAQNKKRAALEPAEKAREELEKAKKKLEDLLRQLREEELERLLTELKARCEKMLAMQIQVFNGTKSVARSIDGNNDKKPNRNNTQDSLGLSDSEKKIVEEASKAIELLEAEGSAVAFHEVFTQVRDDMKNVQRRLGVVDVGKVTQAVEQDIIDTLGEMIKALEKAKQDMQNKKSPPSNGQPPPNQDQKLLDQIAELKMIRAMQIRVNNRTRLYGRQYEGEQAGVPAVQTELRNLADRQERIFDVTNKIAKGDNR